MTSRVRVEPKLAPLEARCTDVEDPRLYVRAFRQVERPVNAFTMVVHWRLHNCVRREVKR